MNSFLEKLGDLKRRVLEELAVRKARRLHSRNHFAKRSTGKPAKVKVRIGADGRELPSGYIP